MEEHLREMNELELKGFGDRLAVVHKGQKGVERKPQVSLPS